MARRRLGVAVGLLVVLAVLTTVVVLARGGAGPDHAAIGGARPSAGRERPAPTDTSAPRAPYRMGTAVHPPRPGAMRTNSHIFSHNRLLVAYYGTAGSGSLGVLGETPPAEMDRRLTRAAAAFRAPNQPVQKVYELIVTVADGAPGRDGDYSHDIAAAQVRRYIAAAHRHHALLLLDLQPGRSGFLDVARRWAWALRDPYVGLALDPEWRMHGSGVPGRVIGWVGAQEVNRVSSWLVALQRRDHLPEKLFLLHEFRRDMVRPIDGVRPRPGLAEVQHVDGFGTPGQKLATFHAVARPGRFFLGFKLFYDEDRPRMSADAVRAVRPDVRFVSFQ